MEFLSDYKFEAALVLLGILCLTGLLSMCSGSKTKTFQDLSKEYCGELDSTVLFANEDKKMVVCK